MKRRFFLAALVLAMGFSVQSSFADIYTRTVSDSAQTWSQAAWTVNGSTNQSWADANAASITIGNSNQLSLDQTVSAEKILFTGLGTGQTATFSGSSVLTLTNSSDSFSVDSGTVLSSVSFDAATTLVKTGAGTLTLNRSGGNGNKIASVIVDQGILSLNGSISHNWTVSQEGYFKDTNYLVKAGGELLVSSSGNLRRDTLVTVDGGILTFNNEDYFNTLTLKNGATVRDGSSATSSSKFWRIQGGTINAEGDSGSKITSNMCFVKGGGDSASFNVADTASEVDLLVSGIIYDHPGGYNGTILYKQGAGLMELSGTNTWAAGTEVQAGTLRVTNSSALGGGKLVLNGATTKLELAAGLDYNVSELSGTGGIAITGSSSNATNLTVGAANTNTAFSGQMATGLTFNKTGTGTLTLRRALGNQQKIAGLNVNGGKLVLDGGSIEFDAGYFKNLSVVNVASGAELVLNQNWELNRDTAVTLDGGTLSFCADNYVNSITLKNGALIQDLSGSSTKKWRAQKSITVAGDTGSTITADLCLVKQMNLDTLTFNVGDTSDAVDLTFSGTIQDHTDLEGTTVVKAGAGTLKLTGDKTNNMQGTFKITQGTVELARGGVTADNTGTFTDGSLEVSGTGVLLVSSAWAINRTPVVVRGEDATLQVNSYTYANSVSLIDGGDISGSGEFRVGYLSAPVLNVSQSAAGLGTGSVIDGSGAMTLVKYNSVDNYTVNVADTDAPIDLTISKKITDLGNYAGMSITFDGGGTVLLENTQSDFAGSVVVKNSTTLRAASAGSLGAQNASKSLTLASGGTFVTPNNFSFAGQYNMGGIQDVLMDVAADGSWSTNVFTLTGEGAVLSVDSAAAFDLAVGGDGWRAGDVIDWMAFRDNPVSLIQLADGAVRTESSADAIRMNFDPEIFGNVPDLFLMGVWSDSKNAYISAVGVPEPSSWLLLVCALVLVGIHLKRRRIGA